MAPPLFLVEMDCLQVIIKGIKYIAPQFASVEVGCPSGDSMKNSLKNKILYIGSVIG
jgi:hypothetical protein